METLDQFKRRVYAFSESSIYCNDEFVTHGELSAKVEQCGKFKTFHGSAVAFDLSDNDKAFIRGISDSLYTSCSDMLAEPLNPKTYHMPLHNLLAGEYSESEFCSIRNKTKWLIDVLKNDFTKPIQMRSTWVFNMMNTSIVIGLEPTDDENYRQLCSLYNVFNEVAKITYLFTPHITVAYYKPGVYSESLEAVSWRYKP